jgi:hypothetical protein
LRLGLDFLDHDSSKARQSSLAARENIIARRRTSAAFGKTHGEVALNDPLCGQWN